MGKEPKEAPDSNQLAASTVSQATDRPILQPEERHNKNPAAVELGRLGGLRGGKARAAKLTAEQRKEIAKKAARTRWHGKNAD